MGWVPGCGFSWNYPSAGSVVMEVLTNLKCEPCAKGGIKLSEADIQEYLKDFPLWEVITEGAETKLKRIYSMENFKSSLAFVNRIGYSSEEEGHHPVIRLEYKTVTVWWWTHKTGGISKNDFIMAAKTDELYNR